MRTAFDDGFCDFLGTTKYVNPHTCNEISQLRKKAARMVVARDGFSGFDKPPTCRPQSMPRRILHLLGITALHFVASVAALLWSFGTTSAQFDNRPVSWLAKHLAAPLTEVLWFPLATAAQALNSSFVRAHPAAQYLVLLANSFLWATALLLAGALIMRRLSDPPSQKQNAAQAKGGVHIGNQSPPSEAIHSTGPPSAAGEFNR